MEGKLITFEGIDGSGKTTQINLLKKKLNDGNIPFSIVREPGGTELSEKIRGILLDKKNMHLSSVTESLLFVSARSQLMLEKILPELNKNKIVICDRFIDSTVAYQGYGRGLDVKYLEKLNFFGTYGRLPDLTIIIDIDPEDSMGRMMGKKPDRMESSGLEFYCKVQKGYHEIAMNASDRCKLIDGNQSIKDVFDLIWSFVNEKILKEV